MRMSNMIMQNEICKLKIDNVDKANMQNEICKLKTDVYNMIIPNRPSPKISVKELVKKHVLHDMYMKTREFRMIWNKIFILEICEVWLKIDNYDMYK